MDRRTDGQGDSYIAPPQTLFAGGGGYKKNYRPVSILPTISKIYEMVLSDQLVEFFNNIFHDFLCAFRKGHECQTVNYKVQFCAFKGDTQNLPLRRVGRGDLPLAVPRG